MCCSRRLAGVVALLLLAIGCRKAPQREVERLAILPVENLTGASEFEGTAAAIAALVHSQTTGLNHLYSYRPPSAVDVASGRPTQVLRGYIEPSGRALTLRAFLQDGQTGKTQRIIETNGTTAVALARALANAVTANTRSAGSTNVEAVEIWGKALAERSANSIGLLRRAVAADPGFGEAWLALLQALAVRGDRVEAAKVVREALSHDTGQLTKALLEQSAAGIDGKAEAQRFAIEQLARLQPADAEANRRAANQHLARRGFPKAIAFFAKAVRADPESPELWNEMGYAQAYDGQFDAAARSIVRYQQLNPHGANPHDSLGDVHFIAGRFADAERSYLEGYKKDPRFLGAIALRKAAEARRMMGDMKAADTHLEKYLGAAGNSPAATLLRARWLHDSGRIGEAEKLLESQTGDRQTPPDFVSQAWAQISIWRMQSGDRQAARALAEKAMRAASSDAARQLAALSLFVAGEPRAVPEWTAAAERLSSDPGAASLKRYALAYALLLAGHYAEAAGVLEQLYQQTTPDSDGPVRTLYAWALVESEKLDQARPLMARFAAPQVSAEGVFDCLVFPRILALKSRLATEKARADEWMALYRNYGGR